MIKAVVRTKLQVWPVLLRANQRLRGYPTQSTDYFFGGNYILDWKYVHIILLLKAKREKSRLLFIDLKHFVLSLYFLMTAYKLNIFTRTERFIVRWLAYFYHQYEGRHTESYAADGVNSGITVAYF